MTKLFMEDLVCAAKIPKSSTKITPGKGCEKCTMGKFIVQLNDYS